MKTIAALIVLKAHPQKEQRVKRNETRLRIVRFVFQGRCKINKKKKLKYFGKRGKDLS